LGPPWVITLPASLRSVETKPGQSLYNSRQLVGA
jgi:hypothetical protein